MFGSTVLIATDGPEPARVRSPESGWSFWLARLVERYSQSDVRSGVVAHLWSGSSVALRRRGQTLAFTTTNMKPRIIVITLGVDDLER